MRSRTSLAIVALTLFTSPLVRAQGGGGDLVGRNLFSPDFVIANAEAIQLKDEEKQAMQELMRQRQDHFMSVQKGMMAEAEALGKLLAEDPVKIEAVMAQFDKLGDREREMKRAQFELMVKIRAALSPDQRAKLAEIRGKNQGGQMRPDIAAKMDKLREGARKWQSEGRDPSQLREVMQRFDPLMRAGKLDEASAVLDEALKALEK